jgi:hypothetical protein
MGFFSIDRGTVTAMLGAFLTYLIILMQWPSVDEDALPDFVQTLCCVVFANMNTTMERELVRRTLSYDIKIHILLEITRIM